MVCQRDGVGIDELKALPGVAATGHVGEGGVVTGICSDSRKAQKGDLFVAIRGYRQDGVTFAGQALRRGAVAVAGESAPKVSAPFVSLTDPRLFLAHASRRILRRRAIPTVLGVTGTKGKTTVVHAIAHLLSIVEGKECGILSTLVYRAGHRNAKASRTTPEAPEIERYLQWMGESGSGRCAMEVSSHSIILDRVTAIPFAGLVFTNLGRDHLDFHGTEEDYFAAKARLFERADRSAFAVLNVDDPRGRDLCGRFPGRVIGYGRSADASVRLLGIEERSDGIAVSLLCPSGEVALRSSLLGAFNGMNLAAAMAVAVGLSIDPGEAAKAMASFLGVPGRMEPVSLGQPFLCLVDYAHNPEGLREALTACRTLAGESGRVIAVFGCGGDRDRGKRPLMGSIAAGLADSLVLTSDNPRSEDPLAILLDVELGVTRREKPRAAHRIEPDRRRAIEIAVRCARAGDVVLIAGKGHETEQVTAAESVLFDDRTVAREAIADRLKQERGKREARTR